MPLNPNNAMDILAARGALMVIEENERLTMDVTHRRMRTLTEALDAFDDSAKAGGDLKACRAAIRALFDVSAPSI